MLDQQRYWKPPWDSNQGPLTPKVKVIILTSRSLILAPFTDLVCVIVSGGREGAEEYRERQVNTITRTR